MPLMRCLKVLPMLLGLLGLSACGGGASAPGLPSTSVPPPETSVPGTLALSTAAMTVAQSDGKAIIIVTRRGGGDGALSMTYRTTNGSAAAGTDYSASTGTLNWASGDVGAKSFAVPISSAIPFSGSKTFTVVIGPGNSTSATIGSPSNATITINGSRVSIGAIGSAAAG